MTVFRDEIHKVVTKGLEALDRAIEGNVIPNNPVSATNYMNVWVTKVIKDQRFDSCVSKILLEWQKQARTLGTKAQLRKTFEALKATLDGAPTNVISAESIQALYADLQQKGWLITTEYEVSRKVTHQTQGQSSLVVCSAKWQKGIDTETQALIKPVSLYVRGSVQEVVDLAYRHGLLLFKMTDYKSLVKYHGEFVLFPNNQGSALPESPSNG